MEFGKHPEFRSKWQSIDWCLPPVDASQAFPRTSTHTRVFIGAPAWGRKEWVGKIYPHGSTAREWLSHYARSFDCIELNSTHYRIPDTATLRHWTEAVGHDFRFCPKIPAAITHSPTGLADPSLIREWLNSLAAWGPTLGPCFAQFPPSFSLSEASRLRPLLDAWPQEFQLSLEFRHPSWFVQGERRIREHILRRLRERGVGLVVTDVAGRRDVLHLSLSAPWLLIRFIGNEHPESDLLRIRHWMHRLRELAEHGVSQIYFFLHQPDDQFTIESAEQLLPALMESELDFRRRAIARVASQLELLHSGPARS